MPLPSRITRPNTSGGLSRTFYEAKLRRRSNARRCTLCFVLFLGCLAVLYEALWTFWLAGVNIPDVEHDPSTGKDRVRRRPDLSTKFDPNLHNRVHTYVVFCVGNFLGIPTVLNIQLTPCLYLFAFTLLTGTAVSPLMPSWKVSLH